ncbi:zf-DHHC-domain-containing protein [Nadsonia fulvescens var. elongata DSM 6958]|uniref:Palmitoyltransferase PFA4 n=1 Tax=Nadsonia fulvescens var. elongata DSM 6958 TaxID=857566 RepID=A0A1E3PJ82_9ASCO|nr:zf-DHHC-domain-containing protein [Nadsonia fulvescens var. elongata DSM 6958]
MAVQLSWRPLGIIIPGFIIAFTGYCGHYYVLRHHLPYSKQVLFQCSLTMVWISYFLAIIMPPGAPPVNFKHAPGEWKRWCYKCEAPKPERAHHCKQCGQCVLKMDHHCPWTNNCVGHQNLPYFFRFLVWVDITTSMILYHLLVRAYGLYRDRFLPMYLIQKSDLVFTIILIPVSFFVLLTISILTVRVISNTIDGKTEIETWECERVESLIRRKIVPKPLYDESETGFPYDIDIWINLTEALGSPFLWLFPFGSPKGDGLHFQKNEQADEGAIWPPDLPIMRLPNEESLDNNDTLDHKTSSTSKRLLSKRNIPSENRLVDGIYSSNHHQNELQREFESDSDSSENEPEWRRGIKSDDDFYQFNRWANWDGEKISDFGVDIESDVPLR